MARETTIQIVYQTIVIIHQFIKFPTSKLIYSDSIMLKNISPTTRWIFGLLVQLFSILTSAFCTLIVPKEKSEWETMRKFGKFPNHYSHCLMLLKILCFIAVQSCLGFFIMFLLIEHERFQYVRSSLRFYSTSFCFINISYYLVEVSFLANSIYFMVSFYP